jgi:hypothetical protein
MIKGTYIKHYISKIYAIDKKLVYCDVLLDVEHYTHEKRTFPKELFKGFNRGQYAVIEIKINIVTNSMNIVIKNSDSFPELVSKFKEWEETIQEKLSKFINPL